MSHPDASIEERIHYLEDRIEIQDLVARYGLGQDLHRDGDNDVLEQWRQVFAPDAVIDYTASGVNGSQPISVDDLVESMRGAEGGMAALIRWQHLEAWAAVEIDGDTAVARVPHLHTHKGQTNGQGWNLIEAGMFVDQLQRRPEGWRIVHRTLEILWIDSFPVSS